MFCSFAVNTKFYIIPRENEKVGGNDTKCWTYFKYDNNALFFHILIIGAYKYEFYGEKLLKVFASNWDKLFHKSISISVCNNLPEIKNALILIFNKLADTNLSKS